MNKAIALSVARAGFLTTVQDLGRRGFRRFGVSVGGALDTHALRIANLLVENEETAAGLEITLGGFRGHFEDRRLVAWCGGGFDVRIGSTSLPAGRAGLIEPGEELALNPPKIGCRAWLAISGGINVAPILESRSTDLRAEFGGLDGRALRDGDVIPLGSESASARTVGELLVKSRISAWSAPVDWTMSAKSEPVLRFTRGNDWGRFNPSAHHALSNAVFTVSPDSNRMGARLDGPPLWRDDMGDLISEAVVPGTIQVPPRGKLILLLRDCQTIGGYPKIAHVITADFPIAAQLRPGDALRFKEISLPEAHRFLFQRERDLGLFRVGLETRAA
ncbi:MAG: antagonist of KipI [Verrucomicrobiota bacterium]